MKLHLQTCLAASLLALAASVLPAQTVPPPNYEEGKVPQYKLPDPLVLSDGQRVTDAATWREKRRPEVLRLFEQYVYGKAPGKPEGVSVQPRSVDRNALGGRAIRKEVTIHLSPDGKEPKIDLLTYLPKKTRGPSPVFLALNFKGNHTIHADPGITPSDVRELGSQQPGKPSARGGCQGPRGNLQSLADREDRGPRIRRGNGLVRRHRTRRPRRAALRRAEALLERWTNRARR